MMQQEEHSSMRRTCAVLEISRSEYYRKVKQMHDYPDKSGRAPPTRSSSEPKGRRSSINDTGIGKFMHS